MPSAERYRSPDPKLTPQNKMDTRKFDYRAGSDPHNQALIYDEGTSVDVAVTYNDEGGKIAAELARRWNAHLGLVAMLKEFIGSDGYGEGDMEDLRNEADQLLNTLNND